MDSKQRFRMRVGAGPIRILVPALAVGMALAAAAQPERLARAVPGTLTFSQMNASATVTLMSGDAALPVSAIKGVKALASDHNYIEMFIIEKPKSGPATLTVKPNPEHIEVGSYDLTFDTTAGTIIVAVQAPLDAHKDIVQKRMEETGKSEEEAKRELGLVTSSPYEKISVTLPEKVYVGRPFRIDLPGADGRSHVWTVDGKIVAEGGDQSTFNYVFEKPGDYAIGVKEYSKNVLVAEWTGGLLVVGEPPVPVSVKAKTKLELAGPEGFGSHVWQVDGKQASEAPAFTHAFASPGAHVIECIARESKADGPGAFRHITWAVTVTP